MLLYKVMPLWNEVGRFLPREWWHVTLLFKDKKRIVHVCVSMCIKKIITMCMFICNLSTSTSEPDDQKSTICALHLHHDLDQCPTRLVYRYRSRSRHFCLHARHCLCDFPNSLSCFHVFLSPSVVSTSSLHVYLWFHPSASHPSSCVARPSHLAPRSAVQRSHLI